MQLVEYYQLCAGQLTVPEDYTLWKDVKLGSQDALELSGISNGDCEYEIGEISITINQEDQAEQSDNQEQQNDYVTTVQPEFTILEQGSGGPDYTKVAQDTPGQILVDATLMESYDSLVYYTIDIPVSAELNNEETAEETTKATIYFVCDPVFSPISGPQTADYTLNDPVLSLEYILKTEKRPCMRKETYFEVLLSELDAPIEYQVDQEGKLVLTVQTDDFGWVDQSVEVEIREVDGSFETNFQSIVVLVHISDPCKSLDLLPIDQVSLASTDQLLSIWWEPFTTSLPDWCIADVVEIEIGKATYLMSSTEMDPLGNIYFESRLIDLNVDQLGTDVESIDVTITEAILLQDGTYAGHKSSKTFSVPIGFDPDSLSQPQSTIEQEIPQWVQNLINSSIKNIDSERYTENDAETSIYSTPEDETKESGTPNYSDSVKIADLDLSEAGLLTLHFSTSIKTLELESEIESAISMFVISDQYEFGSRQISIENYELTRTQGSQIEIQIKFNHPEEISKSYASLDDLQLTILKPEVFKSEQTELALGHAPGSKFTILIPPQISQEVYDQVQAFDEAIDKPITYVSQLSFAVNLVLAYGLKYMWSMANVLQFLIFISNWKINLDPFANALLEQLKKLAFFEFVDTKPIKEEIAKFLHISIDSESSESGLNRRRLQELLENDEGSLKEAPSSDRFGSKSLFDNSGVMILIGIILLLLVAILALFGLILRKSAKARSAISKIWHKIFYNTLIRFSLQSALKMQMAAATVIALSSAGEIVSSMIIILIFNVLAIIFGIVLISKRKELHETESESRYGSLYAGLRRTNTSLSTLLQPTLFMLRRSFFVLISFILIDEPSLQVQALICCGMLYLVYLILAVDYIDRGTKIFEVTNEAFFLLSAYFFMVFTDSGSLSAQMRAQLGMSQISVIGLIILVNFSIIVRANVIKLRRSLYLRSLKKRQNIVLNEREIAIQTLKCAMCLNNTVNWAQSRKKAEIRQVLDLELARVDKKSREDLKPEQTEHKVNVNKKGKNRQKSQKAAIKDAKRYKKQQKKSYIVEKKAEKPEVETRIPEKKDKELNDEIPDAFVLSGSSNVMNISSKGAQKQLEKQGRRMRNVSKTIEDHSMASSTERIFATQCNEKMTERPCLQSVRKEHRGYSPQISLENSPMQSKIITIDRCYESSEEQTFTSKRKKNSQAATQFAKMMELLPMASGSSPASGVRSRTSIKNLQVSFSKGDSSFDSELSSQQANDLSFDSIDHGQNMSSRNPSPLRSPTREVSTFGKHKITSTKKIFIGRRMASGSNNVGVSKSKYEQSEMSPRISSVVSVTSYQGRNKKAKTEEQYTDVGIYERRRQALKLIEAVTLLKERNNEHKKSFSTYEKEIKSQLVWLPRADQ